MNIVPSIMATKKSAAKNLRSTVTKVYLLTTEALKDSKITHSESIPEWIIERIGDEKEVSILGSEGPIIFKVIDTQSQEHQHYNLIADSNYSIAREALGSLVGSIKKERSKKVEINFFGLDEEMVTGAIVGLELALYRYNEELSHGSITFLDDGKKVKKSIADKALAIAQSINTARHLVNLPANLLNPVTYTNAVKKHFAKSSTMKVVVYDEKKLEKEKCGLILSVGQAAANPPRIVHLKYRPAGAKGKPTAIVGKGITFDSGGLNVKSGAGMGVMKKDMGGSATVMGFATWLENSGVKKKVDIYLALAENAINEHASRPGDIYTSRNGLKVEIGNTDAEGRLALADAMDIAITQKEKPEVLIDFATLTGAAKVSMGDFVTSMFANDDELADKLLRASQANGDLSWRMPLYRPYYKGFKSNFADMNNMSKVKGGSIGAALFLEKFIGDTKWAHFDIFGWTSGFRPSLVQQGGSGQGVETLIGYFKN